MHNIDENEVLRDVLSGLKDDVPPMPEGLHAAWMQKVEDDMAEKRTEKTLNRRAFTRFLSVAAALVFVVGGTLLTRDDMALHTRSDSEYQELMAENGALPYRADDAASYNMKLAAYEAAEEESAAYDDGVMLTTTMARGASYDAAPVPEPAEKKVIRNASLTIQTQSYEGSLASLRALCEAEGGWVEYSRESVNSTTGLRTASLTLRIPQDTLDGYLAGTAELGRITSRSESAEDVTASYQDTRARLDTQLALMERLQALMDEAGDLSDLLALESQIADTQYTIDALQSSLSSTDRQVDYSTVTVTLKEETTVELTDDTVTLGERIRSAVRVGWEAFTGFLGDMAVFVVAALPFIAVVAVVVIAYVIIRKIRRRKNP